MNKKFSKYKSTGVYLRIINISRKVSSRLSMIIPFGCFSANQDSDHKQKIYCFFLKTLNNYFKDPLAVRFGTYDLEFSLKVLCICSDNLSAHEILGLSKSFKASHFCRFCIDNSITSQVNFSENKSILRSKESIKMNLNVYKTKKNRILLVSTLKGFAGNFYLIKLPI